MKYCKVIILIITLLFSHSSMFDCCRSFGATFRKSGGTKPANSKLTCFFLYPKHVSLHLSDILTCISEHKPATAQHWWSGLRQPQLHSFPHGRWPWGLQPKLGHAREITPTSGPSLPTWRPKQIRTTRVLVVAIQWQRQRRGTPRVCRKCFSPQLPPRSYIWILVSDSKRAHAYRVRQTYLLSFYEQTHVITTSFTNNSSPCCWNPCSKQVFDEIIELNWERDSQASLVDITNPHSISFSFNPRPTFHSILTMLNIRRPRVRLPSFVQSNIAWLRNIHENKVLCFLSFMQTSFVVGVLTYVSSIITVNRSLGGQQPRVDFRLQVDDSTQDFVTWGHWAEFLASLDTSTLPCVVIFEVYRVPEQDKTFKCLAVNE